MPSLFRRHLTADKSPGALGLPLRRGDVPGADSDYGSVDREDRRGAETVGLNTGTHRETVASTRLTALPVPREHTRDVIYQYLDAVLVRDLDMGDDDSRSPQWHDFWGAGQPPSCHCCPELAR